MVAVAERSKQYCLFVAVGIPPKEHAQVAAVVSEPLVWEVREVPYPPAKQVVQSWQLVEPVVEPFALPVAAAVQVSKPFFLLVLAVPSQEVPLPCLGVVVVVAQASLGNERVAQARETWLFEMPAVSGCWHRCASCCCQPFLVQAVVAEDSV